MQGNPLKEHQDLEPIQQRDTKTNRNKTRNTHNLDTPRN